MDIRKNKNGQNQVSENVVGNRISSHRSSSYSFSPFNKIASTQTATYGGDANGNMVQKSEGKEFWRYDWDYENRLTQASTRKQTVRYAYDALGRRVRRNLAGSRENTKYTYDGLDVVMDDNAGTQTKYLNGVGIDNKLRSTNGANVSYFLADHLGSTNGLTNSSGSLTASNSYDSFGNPTNPAFSSRYQFTGREFDSFSGLQFSRARFYDPQIGRFISEDPIGFGGGDVNLYGYVWNNPQNWFDPFGLDGFKLPESPGPNGENLPKGWRPDPGHQDPNGERWVSPNGDEGLDFHKGRPGETGFKEDDHWHKLKPGRGGKGLQTDKDGGRKGGHYLPGDEVELNNPQFCPARIPSLSQPTPEEIRLQIDAANNMEAFWTKILLGSAAAGGGYLLPGLIPALIPTLPGLAPQFAH